MTEPTAPKMQKPLSYDSIFDFPEIAVEEIVEPHSFRNNLMRALGYTAVIPIFMLGFFQLQQFQQATQIADQAQLAMAQSIAETCNVHVEAAERVLQVLANHGAADAADVLSLKDNLRTIARRGGTDIAAVGVFSDSAQPLALAYAGESAMPAEMQQALREVSEGKRTEPLFSYEKDGEQWLFIAASVRSELLKKPQTAVALLSAKFLDDALHRVLGERKFNAVIRTLSGDCVASLYQSDLVLPFELDASLQQSIRASENGFLIRTPGTRDKTQFRAYVYIPKFNWVVSVSQPLKVRDEVMMASVETSGFFLFMAVVLTIIVGYMANRPITRSVNAMMQAVEDFGRTGRFSSVSEQLEKDGITEIIELGERFERMAGDVSESKRKLERLNAKLEEEVAERTSSLLQRNTELRALQQLLLPMQSEKDSVLNLKAHVQGSVDQFRALLGLAELTFVPAGSATAAAGNAITVALAGTTYGHLATAPGTVFTPDRTDSLRRLANSLAIVLANNALVMQLANEHATLNAVFESMTDGVVILGKSGRIIYANEYACRLINDGKPLVGLYGQQHMFEWYGQEILPEAKSGRTRLVRRTAKAATQTIEIVRFVVAGLPGYEGERRGWLIRDISREAGIDAMKENLVSVVAHELKTPITALRLLTETVKKDAQAGRPSNPGDVGELMDETLRLGQLIDDILDVSRIEGGAMKLDKRPVQLASLIDRAARLAKTRYPIEVRRTIEEAAEVICVDPSRITQLLINLFVNAARYRKAEQETAFCSVQAFPVPTGGVCIRVTDEGRGIEADRLARIFEPFYQTDMTNKRQSGGAGLGLTIVKGIVEAHEGEIRVESTLGVSTSFIVTLPA